MSTIDEMHVRQARDEIVRLNKQLADEQRKISDAVQSAIKLREQASRASSPSTARSKLNQAERKDRDQVQAQKRVATIQDKISKATKKLHESEAKLTKTRESQAKKLERDLRLASDSRLNTLREDFRGMALPVTTGSEPEYDVFLSHASPDKDGLVRPLAEALEKRDISFFFDEVGIGWGDSIRQSIDQALAKSRFGIVALSPDFLAVRHWTEQELNGLFAKEDASGRKVILPLWHNVTKEQVTRYSPLLADRAALKTADFTFDEIAQQLEKLVAPGTGGTS